MDVIMCTNPQESSIVTTYFFLTISEIVPISGFLKISPDAISVLVAVTWKTNPTILTINLAQEKNT